MGREGRGSDARREIAHNGWFTVGAVDNFLPNLPPPAFGGNCSIAKTGWRGSPLGFSRARLGGRTGCYCALTTNCRGAMYGQDAIVRSFEPAFGSGSRGLLSGQEYVKMRASYLQRPLGGCLPMSANRIGKPDDVPSVRSY